MGTVSIRDLTRNAGSVVEEVERSGRPALVTRHGKPVAVIFAVDEESLEDYLLAHAPEYVQGRQAAEAELARGETRPLSAILEELDGPQ